MLLDHGLTVRVEEGLVRALGEMIQALQDGDLDCLTGALEKAGLKLGPEADLDTLLGLLLGGEPGGDPAEGGDGDLGEMGLKLGASVGGIPVELLLMGRAIGLIDGTVRRLDPDLDTIGIVARHVRGP